MNCLYCKKLRHMIKDCHNKIVMEVITKNPNEYNYKQSKVCVATLQINESFVQV